MSRILRSKRVGPAYPVREALLGMPGVLEEHVPAGWKPLVATRGLAVVFAVAGLALPAGWAQDASAAGGAVVVAPIFEHGAGRATTGCMVISPPVFVTEEEARAIITEELGKVGVKMTQKDVEMKGVGIRAKKFGGVEKDGKWESVQVPGDPKPLVADLADPEKHVAVEFISAEDYKALGGEMAMSSVQSYDFKKVGTELVEQIKAGKGEERIGVFYDPAGSVEYKRPTEEELKGKTAEEMTKMYSDQMTAQKEVVEKAAQEELRKQVREFAAWLKKQGVI